MLELVTDFLDGVGLPTRAAPVPETTVLPGIRIVAGVLEYDAERLLSPGDLLHEAGHLALLPAAERAACEGDVGSDGGLEMGAMAWSYAALVHLGLDPTVVFHDEGYKGDAESLVTAFAGGSGPGLPILTWKGLTTASAYPRMDRWLAD